MELNIVNSGNEVNPMTVSDEVFNCPYNEALIHQVVTSYLAAARSGSATQKSRSEVTGSKKKLWKQKGTGRARVGAGKVNVWRGGGVAFPAKPCDYAKKVNRKMYRGAMASILSELLRTERLIVVDQFQVDSLKTKNLLKKLEAMSFSEGLIVTDEIDRNLALAVRNIPTVDLCSAKEVDPVNLISFKKVIITTAAIKAIEEWLK